MVVCTWSGGTATRDLATWPGWAPRVRPVGGFPDLGRSVTVALDSPRSRRYQHTKGGTRIEAAVLAASRASVSQLGDAARTTNKASEPLDSRPARGSATKDQDFLSARRSWSFVAPRRGLRASHRRAYRSGSRRASQDAGVSGIGTGRSPGYGGLRIPLRRSNRAGSDTRFGPNKGRLGPARLFLFTWNAAAESLAPSSLDVFVRVWSDWARGSRGRDAIRAFLRMGWAEPDGALQQTAIAIRVHRGIEAFSAAAAAELCVRPPPDPRDG